MKSKITITVDSEVLEQIQKLSESESRSVSSLINKILKDFIGNK